MQKGGEQFFYSPSDLITFMESRFASFMERWKLIDARPVTLGPRITRCLE